jgi:hypothetical protein
MSNGKNADKFHLRDLLRTLLHAQLLLQRALDIVIQQFHKNARLHHTDTTGTTMYDDIADLGTNNLAFTILRDSDINPQSTDAEVSIGTNHGDDQLPDAEARDEATDVHLDDRIQLKRNIESRRAD